jgi:SeqA protein N-terminal domain
MDTKKKKSSEPTSKKKVDFTIYGKCVRISNETYQYITEHGQFGETFNEVLRRLLGLQ